jgi:hypothetical protein
MPWRGGRGIMGSASRSRDPRRKRTKEEAREKKNKKRKEKRKGEKMGKNFKPKNFHLEK